MSKLFLYGICIIYIILVFNYFFIIRYYCLFKNILKLHGLNKNCPMQSTYNLNMIISFLVKI